MTDAGSDRQWAPPRTAAPGAPGFDPPQGPAHAPPQVTAPVTPPNLPPAVTVPQLPVSSDAPTPPLAARADAMAELHFDQEPPSRPRRSRLAVGGAVVGVLALGAAGVFAVSQIGGGNAGGAESPAAVGAAMMAAIEQEDMLGMVDLLLPGERETFHEPMITIVDEFSRIEVLSQDVSLDDLSGLDVELSNEATDVRPTNVGDISNITMSATMTTTFRGEDLPIGDLITDALGDGFDLTAFNERVDNGRFELPMTVVEQDGRWYLSLFHTAAEAIRGSEFGDPIPARGVVPRGGDTPEGAIDVLLDGIEQLDLVKVVAGINPNEAQALQRYAPLFLAEAQAALDDVPLNWQVTNTEYRVEGSGSKRFVDITALSIDGVLDGEAFSVAFTDGCAAIDIADQQVDSCAFEQNVDFNELIAEFPELDALTDEVQAAFADYDQPGITVQEVDGQWFVSPIGSGFDQLLAVLAALDRTEVDGIVARVQDVLVNIDDLLTGTLFGGLDDTLVFDDDGFPVFGDIGGGNGEGSSTVDEPAVPDDGELSQELADFEAQQLVAGACYTQTDLDQVVACLSDAIASGELPDYYMSVELRFPECGTGEIALGRIPLYELSDEEYTAMITEASTCFRALIDAGAVAEQDVPPEYLRPECGAGRNPWNLDVADSESSFDAWIECVYS